jgi:hypothetical protein
MKQIRCAEELQLQWYELCSVEKELSEYPGIKCGPLHTPGVDNGSYVDLPVCLQRNKTRVTAHLACSGSRARGFFELEHERLKRPAFGEFRLSLSLPHVVQSTSSLSFICDVRRQIKSFHVSWAR